MTTHERESPSFPESSAPALNLFRLSKNGVGLLQSKKGEIDQFKKEFARANSAYTQLQDEYKNRLETLKQTELDLVVEMLELQSSISCSKAYLKMKEELTKKGLTDKEIINFFRFCLEINCARYKKTDSMSGFPQVKPSYNVSERAYESLEKMMLRYPYPKWFKGNLPQWCEFVDVYSNFAYYLKNKQQTQKTLSSREKTIPYFTFLDELPDWFLDLNGSIPDVDQVKDELEQDLESRSKLLSMIEKINEYASLIKNMSDQKYLKANMWLLKRKSRTFPKVSTFAELILYLEATNQICDWELSIESMEKIDTTTLFRYKLSPETARKRAVEKFINEHSLVSKEIIALWLEKQFQESKIIKSVKETPSPEFMKFFEKLLSDFRDPRSNTESNKLKESNKKLFYLLVYTFYPLIKSFSVNEISYMKELLHTPETNYEEIILEFAGILSTNQFLHILQESSLREDTKIPTEIKQHAKKWIQNNWSRMFGELQKSICADKNEKDDMSRELHIEPLSKETGELAYDLSQSMQNSQAGNLGGWKMKYTLDQRLNPQSLLQIPGDTLEEREKMLSHFLEQNNIPLTIKPGSIIRALDWLVTVPEEVEWLRIKKTIDGTVFRKLKRQRMRIFYSMDTENKEITFFLHLKKAWQYGF